MDYRDPADGSWEGNWDSGLVIYGKFCVDSDNNLYILDLGGDCIQKKSSGGNFILRSDDIGLKNSYPIGDSYAINIGPNGYIYFTQDTGTEGSPAYCINKINPNTLAIEDVLNFTAGEIYYGFAVDSDGGIYIHNNSDKTIENWNFEDGFFKSSPTLTYNYGNSELAIAGNYICGIGFVGTGEPVTYNSEAFIIKKDLSSVETSMDLSEIGISTKTYISSIGVDFLICGINNLSQVVFGRYYIDIVGENITITEIWSNLIDIDSYTDCIIGAYPF